MTTTPTPIAQAVRLLRAAAKDLKDCHTRGDGDWAGEPEALAAHDEHIAAAEALEQYVRPQQCLHQISEPAAPAAHQVLPPSDQDFEEQAALAALTPHAEELQALAKASNQILALVQLPAPAATDSQLLALNEGERYFGESPSKYPECGHGTQYHAGAPGVLAFARAAISLAGTPRRAMEDTPDPVRQAIRDYYYALDNRKHGGVAADQALEAIQVALGMYWVQGQELAARAATGSAA